MNRKVILTLLVVALYGSAFGQILKYRVSANFSKFNKEIGKEEVLHPLVSSLSNPNATEFSHSFEPGFEFELMQLWSPNFETGIELDFSKFSGSNDVPPYYNYYFAPENSNVISSAAEALVYESAATNLLFNFRYYFAPDGKINPFIKVFLGASFVSTELNYEDMSAWGDEPSVLYALGTDNSDEGKESALCYGIGAGIDFKLNEQFSLYLDGAAKYIGTDKLDGIPDYDYDATTTSLKPITNNSFVTQVSLGIVFTSKKDLGLNKNSGGKGKKGGVKRTGRTTPWRPFYRQK